LGSEISVWRFLPFYVIRDIGDGDCRMQSMNISLPDPLKQFVDGQIAQGRYSSVSEYVRELIRADEKRKAEEQLEMLLLDGLRGEEAAFTREDWQAIRQEALTQIKKARKSNV
jgi:antitoxin ParD1/3/4